MPNGLKLNTCRTVFRVLILSVALFLFGRLLYLQAFRTEHYRGLSQKNRTRVIPESALRGIIVDRNGAELAGSRPSFVISVIPREIERHSWVLAKLSARLGTGVDELRRKVRSGRSMPYWPVALRRDMDLQSICYFEERIEQFPGVLFQVAPTRRYTKGKWTGNLLGYVREVTARDIARQKAAGMQPGAYTGAAGIEKQYDNYLRGADGCRHLEVSALGRVVGPMPGEEDKPPTPGSVIMLTIDKDLQQLGDSLLADYGSGAAIAIEPFTGEILCFVNRPGFSANLFSGVVHPDVWNQLLADSLRPLLNRATKGLYPPASVAKLWTAGAALEKKVIDQGTTFNPCYGGLQIGNRYFRCHKASGHGKLSVVDAIAQSCDVFFYQVGLKLGVADWAEGTCGCGFGQKTGIDLPDEDPGLVPDIDYYDRRYGKGGWTKTLAANLAIGQGELLTTPLQVAQFIAGLANHGEVMVPHFLRAYQEPGRPWKIREPELSFRLPFTHETLDLLITGAKGVVADQHGTAHWLADDRYAMAGKTGTAQNPHGLEHAWFAAFAPADEPTIAVAVLVENAGHGSVAAAPIARSIIEAYFEKYYPLILEAPPADTIGPTPIAAAPMHSGG